MNLCKKIDDKYFCLAETFCQQNKCAASQVVHGLCRYREQGFCLIGDLIEIDQQTQDEDAKI